MGVFLVAVATWLTRVENWRSYTPVGGGGSFIDESGYVDEEKPAGIIRWLTTVDHKDIGILYGLYGITAFVVGGLMVTAMRIDLVTTESLLGTATYNGLLTSHGITMLFLFGTPIIAAFSNYLIPLIIGADDMAFPRINAIAFWLLPPAALLIWAGFFAQPLGLFGPAQTAWTMYTPLSLGEAGASSDMVGGAGVDLMLLGLHLSGVAATIGAINFIATIFTHRGEKVTWANLDIFSWTVLTQSGLILFAFPLLGSALVMLLADRNFGTTFFLSDGGTLLWQHLFWFFGHPEVYILVLPMMGIVSYVLPRFAGRQLFGFKFVVYSTLAIGVLSFGVWAHHMFSTGMDPRLRTSFMAVSMAIAIPSAVKTFNWITTLWNGRIRLTTPMLFCIGFVSNFIIGGVTGVFLASIPVDLVLHDTYYVVGHFHYIVMGAIAFAGFAGIYYWFPLVTKRMYQSSLGKAHFWLTMVGTNVTFFAMILLGYGGMPRRYATYLPEFATLHQVATLGALIIFVGQLIWFWNMVSSWFEGKRVESGDPWNLADDGVNTVEWQWFENKLETSLATDGGEEADPDVATDGGQPESVDGDAADETDA
ncbi:cbb3-type cytochrome c oxidase subunit I [Halohasta litorea]|uniref:Cbb3-type cytochrome c oxidase subunit I n=1 Tax=Halohasta litorea TaxID=869891 RepID=A0ABD6D570_9EURY|nr:cbb3-type cytochrome c oxidase subunit I [Halohasta litorea]MEA1931234.1 cbb3-type cytochrome c oxidase subunit I [Euryarchaeota archaeon]